MQIERDTPDVDWRSVGFGMLAQGGVLFVLFLLGVTIASYAATPIVAGLVAGLTSRNFRDEWIDGMSAAPLGSVLGLFAVDLGIWFTPGASLDVRLNLILFSTGYGLALAILIGPFLVVIGAFVGSLAGALRRTIA